MNIADELKKLQDLHASGGLSEAEYARAKDAILNDAATPPPMPALSPDTLELQTRQWAMFIHLGQLAGYAIPIAGLVLPIILWQIKRNELPGVDVHGKNVCNWIISELIYGALGCALIFACWTGLLILIPLGIIGIIFPIIGGLKANNGEIWKYPLSLTLIK